MNNMLTRKKKMRCWKYYLYLLEYMESRLISKFFSSSIFHSPDRAFKVLGYSGIESSSPFPLSWSTSKNFAWVEQLFNRWHWPPSKKHFFPQWKQPFEATLSRRQLFPISNYENAASFFMYTKLSQAFQV